MNPTGVYVPVHEVFPGIPNDFGDFTLLLRKLSRTDALFWCARLNLIISNPAYPDHKARQQYGLNVFFTREQIERVNRFAQAHGGAERVAIFFRGQLLELIRWICLVCEDQPGDGETFNQPEATQTFAQVALMASDLWARRVYGDRFSLDGGVDLGRLRALGAIRQAIADTSSGMDPLFALGRGSRLFRHYLPQFYPEFEKQFRLRTALSLDQYFTCLSGIMVHYLQRTPELAASGAPGIFNANTFCDPCPQQKPIFSQYLALESQTADELRQAFWGGRTVATPADAGRYDYEPLRRRPILRTADGRAIIIDPVFYAERASVGPLFYAVHNLARRDANQVFAAFGQAFEKYACDILRRIYPEPPPPLAKRLTCDVTGKDQTGREIQIADACLNDVTEVILFEMKAAWVRDDVVLDDDPERYLDHLRERYGIRPGPENNRPVKGVAQLARTINRLAAGEWAPVGQHLGNAQMLYPVLLVHDPFLDAPVQPRFLATEFAACLQPDRVSSGGEMDKGRFRVAPLIVMTIDDLECLETSLEHFSLCTLLRDYSTACKDRLVSLYNFLATSDYGNMLYRSRGLASESLAVLRETMRTLFPTETV